MKNTMTLEYNIIGSSSKGNCLILDGKIMIDLGVSFAKIKPYIKDLKVVCLTHSHSDHFNKTTIHKLIKEKPTIKIICSKYLVTPLIAECRVPKKSIYVLETGKIYNLGMFKCRIEELYHDVPNVCYMIQYNNKNIFYATDTGRIDHISAKDFDYYFVEANYESDEELERQIQIAKENDEYTHLIRVKDTHLSQVQCMDWLYKNMGSNSQYIWMHQHIEKGEEDNNETTIC